jgi:hypothetical protein
MTFNAVPHGRRFEMKMTLTMLVAMVLLGSAGCEKTIHEVRSPAGTPLLKPALASVN